MIDLIKAWLIMRKLEKLVKNPKPFVDAVEQFGQLQEDMLRTLAGKEPKRQAEEQHE